MCCQGVEWKLEPRISVSIPKLVTDATLKGEVISHTTGKLSSHHFTGPRPIHIQELLMASVAVSLIKPQSLIHDSTFICWKYLRFLPWRFAPWARQTLSQVKVYWTSSKFNPADGSACGRPSDWTALTCFFTQTALTTATEIEKCIWLKRSKDNPVLVSKNNQQSRQINQFSPANHRCQVN